MRHLSPLPRRPGGGAWGTRTRGATWAPTDLGSALKWYSDTDPQNLSLTGSLVDAWLNDGGTSGPMTATGSARWTLDSGVTLNGYGALLNNSDDCNMFVATGGPTSTFHLMVLAKSIDAGSSGNNASTFASLGTPGGSGASGIGSTPPSEGPLLWFGGYGNPVIQSVAAPFDTDVRVLELVNDGTTLRAYRDGGLLAEVESVTTLGDGSMGLRWSYPLAFAYAAPRTRVFSKLTADRPLSTSERVAALQFLKRKFALAPRRMIVATGDSTVAGNVPTAGTTTSWIKEMAAQYALAGSPVDYINAGISGQSSQQILNRITPAFLDKIQQAGSTYRPTDLMLCAWYNDPAAGIPYAQTHANLAAGAALAKARGIRVWIGTTFGGVGLAPETLANAYALNEMIVNGASPSTYGAIDWRPLSPWPTTTVQLPDEVHQSTALLQAQATTAIAVIA